MAIRWITPQLLVIDTGSTSWKDIDVSAYIPATATGIFIHTLATGTASGIRKKGSTDNRIALSRHWWGGCGVDNNRVFQYYSNTATTYTVYLVGYTESETVWFTDAVDVGALAGTGAFYDIDISASTGADTSIVAFGQVVSNSAWALRCNGSTDDHTIAGGAYTFTPVDVSEILEMKVGNVGTRYYLMGYTKVGANITTYVDEVDYTVAADAAYHDLSALPMTATGGFFNIAYSAGFNYSYALRTNGSSEDMYNYASHHAYAFVGCDVNRLIEGKIQLAAPKFYLSGYSTTPLSTVSGYRTLKGVGI